MASFHGHADVVRVLAHAKATLGEVKGAAPLSYAVSSDRADVVSVLLERKATANFVDMWGATPLCIASMRGNVHIVRLLIEGGADVNGVSRVEDLTFHRKRRTNGLDEDNDTEGERSGTALSCAAARGDDAMVRLLIGLKADVHTPWCPPPARRATTVQLLLDAKARISYSDAAVV
jgi:ankyrin repeat protein